MREIKKPIEPKEDFVPVFALNSSIDELADKFHLSPQHGADELDEYDVVLLETDTGRPFLLLEYKRSPAASVYIPARMLDRLSRIMAEIAKELRVAESEITVLHQSD